MSVNSLPKSVTRRRRDCDLNPGSSAPESAQHANHALGYRAAETSRAQLDIQPGPMRVRRQVRRGVRGTPVWRLPTMLQHISTLLPD